MKEKAVVFGKASNLVGVLTEPHSSVRRAGVPAVVLLNSGLLHRVGAHRLHVKMARAMALEGVTSLRFDFSGLGDSEVRKDSLAFEQSGPLEVQDAMDFVTTKTAATRFVLAGLCSGADAAFFTACQDERVVGLAQLDGFAYKTWKYYPRRFGPKLLKPESVKGFVGEHAGRWLKPKGDASGVGASDLVQSPYVREFPPLETVAAGLTQLVERDVRLFNFFSREYYGYRGQYRDCFSMVDFRSLLQVEFIREADHTLSDIAHQAFVVDAIRSWYVRGWAVSASTAVAATA